MTLRIAKPLLLTLLGGLFVGNLHAIGSEHPNVIWIIADDLSPDLDCYGYEGVSTPNIDRLARQGARYTAVFTTAPVCSSSRSSLITGVHQAATGTHHHRTLNKKPLPEPVEPITELLRRAGYFVCNGNSAMNGAGKDDCNFAFQGKMYDPDSYLRWWKKELGLK